MPPTTTFVLARIRAREMVSGILIVSAAATPIDPPDEVDAEGLSFVPSLFSSFGVASVLVRPPLSVA